MRRLPWLLAAALAGCGGEAGGVAVPLDQLPAGFLDQAQRELPDVKFTRAVRKSNGVLEIKGKDSKGRTRDVEIDPQGKVVEVE